ncbi:GumC family protein [Rhizobium sp. Root482]|uniref:GumC family protein n=1 Tax=Rhizobium sp. Root482 TaxID=1736543 RepID=UPI0006FD5580|nr:polysaccharide biosynthesis tyrosine autokinase [Rhizobium sp. Root482]KQY26670.1 hypothetical protein ASD31_00195 [Rhizobium sp. Root482]
MIRSDPIHISGETSQPFLLSVVAERKVLFGSCIVIGLCAGLIGYAVSPPRYMAETVLALDVRKLQALPTESVVSALPQESPVLRTEIDIIGSRMMAERVLQSLFDAGTPQGGEVLSPDAAATMEPGPRLKEARRIDQTVGASLDLTRPAIIHDLMTNVRAVNDGRSYTIYISFRSGSPQYAAAVANAYGEAYIAYQLDLKTSATRRVSEWLGSRLVSLRSTLEESERKATTFREASGLVKANGLTLQSQQIGALNVELAAMRGRLAVSTARLETAVSAVATGDDGLSLTEVLASPTIQQLRVEEARISRSVTEIEESGATKNPQITTLRSQLASIRRQIVKETHQIIGSLRNEISVSQRQQAGLESSLQEMQDAMSKTSESLVHADQLDREASANRAIYESYLTRYKQTIEQDGIATAEARVISRAMRPTRPASPNFTLWMLIGAIAGTGAGMSLALLRHLTDRSVRSIATLAEKTGLAVVGRIPGLSTADKSVAATLITDSHSPFGDAFADLQASLRLKRKSAEGYVIALTSATPATGKSFVTANLARSLAAMGTRTIVVDANLRTPTIAAEFRIAAEPMLERVVLDGLPVEMAIRRDGRSAADILCSAASGLPADFILGKAQFAALIAMLRSRYDVVLIDMPALSIGCDAVGIALLSDATLMVVGMERVDYPGLAERIRSLRLAGVDIVGVVANDRFNVRGGAPASSSKHVRATRSHKAGTSLAERLYAEAGGAR